LTHYKTIQTNGEKKKMYWNDIVYQFMQQKHNADTSQEIFIKIYTRGPLYKPFFIVDSIQGQLIMGPTKKMVATYAVEDLTLIDSCSYECQNRYIVMIYTLCLIGVYLMIALTWIHVI